MCKIRIIGKVYRWICNFILDQSVPNACMLWVVTRTIALIGNSETMNKTRDLMITHLCDLYFITRAGTCPCLHIWQGFIFQMINVVGNSSYIPHTRSALSIVPTQINPQYLQIGTWSSCWISHTIIISFGILDLYFSIPLIMLRNDFFIV